MQQITAPELAAVLADPAREQPLLLDVRENWEFETCRIAGSTQIPMNLIPVRVTEIDDDREVMFDLLFQGRRLCQGDLFPINNCA